MSCEEIIRQTIAEREWLSFHDFMQLALYHPQYGYYMRAQEKFGEQGDFITAPSSNPLFSQCIGEYCRRKQPKHILELGAGNGSLACGVLKYLQKQDALPEKYYIMDVSPTLQKQQQKLLAATLPEYIQQIEWVSEYPTIDGVILANEVLDSLAVAKFTINDDYQLLEEGLCLKDNQLTWQQRAPQTPHLATLFDAIGQHVKFPPGYTSEICCPLPEWFAQLANCLQQGHMLFIDYGFLRKEYYHWQRYQGTLMCHYQHQCHDNPLLHIGKQDITAHVDFDLVAECAQQNGMHVSAYSTQTQFLLAHSIMEFAQQNTDTPLSIRQQINCLTAPHEMGELFKVIELKSVLM